MKTAENIKKVALLFFIILGLAHIISGLMFSNGYFIPTSFIINRTLNIPFAITALVYGFSNIYLELNEESHKTANIIFTVITLLIFIALIYINFLVPDRTPVILNPQNVQTK